MPKKTEKTKNEKTKSKKKSSAFRSSIAAGSADDLPRVGVIDVGSNSVRLVVYEGMGRAPQPIFNERALCGLGRGLSETGRLNREGAEMALKNMARFAVAAQAMRVDRLDVVATEAVRAAKDGPAFVAELEQRFGITVEVLKGEAEARFSALGVVSGIPGAHGAMGDLGGASLEVVELKKGEPARAVTLPVGPFRLMQIWQKSRDQARKIVETAFADLGWISGLGGRIFYPVGGAWRALANIHMQQSAYPLHVIHEYSVSVPDAKRLLGLVMGLSPSSLARIKGVPRKRLDTLPLAAMALDCLIDAMRPDRLVFSAQGLREGLLFDQLTAAQRRQDPLLAACADIASRSQRFEVTGSDLFAWTSPLFGRETVAEQRLRLAACLLGDIAWNEHPDYRAEHAFWRILRLPVTGIDHAGRAFLALAIGARYGKVAGDAGDRVEQLITPEEMTKAQVLGRALRLAFTLSAGNRLLLKRTELRLDKKGIWLKLPKRDGAAIFGEMVGRRFDALARGLGRKPRIEGVDGLQLD